MRSTTLATHRVSIPLLDCLLNLQKGANPCRCPSFPDAANSCCNFPQPLSGPPPPPPTATSNFPLPPPPTHALNSPPPTSDSAHPPLVAKMRGVRPQLTHPTQRGRRKNRERERRRDLLQGDGKQRWKGDLGERERERVRVREKDGWDCERDRNRRGRRRRCLVCAGLYSQPLIFHLKLISAFQLTSIKTFLKTVVSYYIDWNLAHRQTLNMISGLLVVRYNNDPIMLLNSLLFIFFPNSYLSKYDELFIGTLNFLKRSLIYFCWDRLIP